MSYDDTKFLIDFFLKKNSKEIHSLKQSFNILQEDFNVLYEELLSIQSSEWSALTSSELDDFYQLSKFLKDSSNNLELLRDSFPIDSELVDLRISSIPTYQITHHRISIQEIEPGMVFYGFELKTTYDILNKTYFLNQPSNNLSFIWHALIEFILNEYGQSTFDKYVRLPICGKNQFLLPPQNYSLKQYSDLKLLKIGNSGYFVRIDGAFSDYKKLITNLINHLSVSERFKDSELILNLIVAS